MICDNCGVTYFDNKLTPHCKQCRRADVIERARIKKRMPGRHLCENGQEIEILIKNGFINSEISRRCRSSRETIARYRREIQEAYDNCTLHPERN